MLYEKGTEPLSDAHFVMGDIAPFRDTTGKVIEGRAQWREHLRAMGGVEMGHSDIRQAEASHAKRKAAYEARMARASAAATDAPLPPLDAPRRRSGVAAEVLGRLHGRPAPARKELIKLTLDVMKNARRR